MMAELTGTPPEVVRSDDAVAEMRAQRQQAQAEERQAMLQAEQAKTQQAQTAALANTEGAQ